MKPPVDIDAALLRRWPLPQPGDDADKEDRGACLVVAGSRELPGAAVLATTATLRAGAGKVVVATGAGMAQAIAIAMPEARVIGLPEGRGGGLADRGIEALDAPVHKAASLLIGPGLMDEAAACRFTTMLLGRADRTPVVLDAAALAAATAASDGRRPVLLTPHAGEMAHLTGIAKETIVARPDPHAREAARALGAIVVLKGAQTFIAAPDGRCWRHARGVAGLATSGSGDVLAGLIAGLLARGAEAVQAAAWAVWLHAGAGLALSRREGALGYLARDLGAEVPRLLQSFQTRLHAGRSSSG